MKHIVLDLGGVLIELDWERRISNLLGDNFDRQAVLQLWQDSKATTLLESGKISFDDFASQFKQECHIDASIDKIKAEFMLFVKEAYPGVDTLLRGIKAQGYGLSLLSNTNQPHFEHLSANNDFFNDFDQLFLSYKMGMMKPSASIYQTLIDKLDCQAEEITFFDDGEKNIAAAQALGIQAYRVDGPYDIAKQLNLTIDS